MGNEIYYCNRCGSRVSGPDFGGDRSHCAACLGIPVDGRDSSKRIRKPSSGTATAVAARPRLPATVAPTSSRPLLLGGLFLAGALLFALGSLFAPVQQIEREKTTSLFSQPPEPQAVEKTTSLFSQVQEPEELPPPREVPRAVTPPKVDPAAEALAEEIEEAASSLAAEGRFEDALARIKSFPPEHRNTRAWNSLEGLRRQIEARARSK